MSPGALAQYPARPIEMIVPIAPGDKVIVCQNGVFGGRILENVIRAGGVPVLVEDKWGEPVDPQKLADALKKKRAA